MRNRIAIAVLVAFASSTAWANVGIPMLALAWPAYWIAFFPVVFIEAAIVRRMLHQPWKDSLKALAMANLISTLVGIPVVWGILLFIEYVLGTTILSGELTNPISIFVMTIVGAPWIPDSNSPWNVYWAFLILAVSFCGASIWIEYRLLRNRFSGVAYSNVRKAIFYGNIVSYTTVCVFAALFPLTV